MVVVSSSSRPRGGRGAQKLYSEGPEARHCRRSRGVSACSRVRARVRVRVRVRARVRVRVRARVGAGLGLGCAA